jgi:hypothetical protein
MSDYPAELPDVLDAASAAAAWAFGEAVKRAARGQPWEHHARRALPVLAPALGAAVRAGLAAAFGGADVRTAVLRGGIAGFVAVWGQNVRTSTIGGSTGDAQGLVAALGAKLGSSEGPGLAGVAFDPRCRCGRPIGRDTGAPGWRSWASAGGALLAAHFGAPRAHAPPGYLVGELVDPAHPDTSPIKLPPCHGCGYVIGTVDPARGVFAPRICPGCGACADCGLPDPSTMTATPPAH